MQNVWPGRLNTSQVTYILHETQVNQTLWGEKGKSVATFVTFSTAAESRQTTQLGPPATSPATKMNQPKEQTYPSMPLSTRRA